MTINIFHCFVRCSHRQTIRLDRDDGVTLMGHILAFHLIVLACLCGSIAMNEAKSKTPPPLDKTSLANGTALVLNFNHMQPGIHFFVRNMAY